MNECDNCGGVGQCEVGCGGPSNGRQTGSVVSPDAGNGDCPCCEVGPDGPRDKLAALLACELPAIPALRFADCQRAADAVLAKGWHLPKIQTGDFEQDLLDILADNPTAFLETDARSLAAAVTDHFRGAGWRPPLPDMLSPWDAYREAYDAFRRDVPAWKAHFTAHHMHALNAALRVCDPCAEHGDLLSRYVASSLEFDYTADGDGGGEYESDEQEHEAAIANIDEMHRLLNVRAERLMDAFEEIRRLRARAERENTEEPAS